MTTSEMTHNTPSRWVIGLMAEYAELLDRIAERQQMLVIEADPLSGTSALLAAALGASDLPTIAVDARAAAGPEGLAQSIAMAAIATLAPEASAWWSRGGAADRDGLRLARSATASGIDLELLRSGVGQPDQLRRALELIDVLGDGARWLAIDHLDDLLERLRPASRVEILGTLRAAGQSGGLLHQLLVGRTAGHTASALDDEQHPLYRAGGRMRVRRPAPERFVEDLAIDRPWVRAPTALIGAAAELAGGAPAYVWRIVDTATGLSSPDSQDVAAAAWRQLRAQLEPAMAEQFVLLGSVHRSAPLVLSAIAAGLGPYELTLNPKSVYDALARMRARGQVLSPAKQRWAVSDPALASWAREHAAIRARRRSPSAGGRS